MTIHLENFYDRTRAKALAFKLHWLQAHYEDPEHFPLEMSPDAWDEHFHHYDENPFKTSKEQP